MGGGGEVRGACPGSRDVQGVTQPHKGVHMNPGPGTTSVPLFLAARGSL